MKKAIFCLTLVGLLGLGGPAAAEICAVDDVPAATLLLPYFEVDLDSANGINTLFSINNASAVDTIAHVVVWSDLSVPVLDFNVYLTGFDVQTISVRDILNGILPQTGVPEDSPSSIESNQGEFSVLAGNPVPLNRSSCVDQLPYSQLPANFVAHLQSTLTGGPSTLSGAFAGRCAGTAYDDDPATVNVDESRIARGYITVDDANLCSLDFPGDPGYFVAGGLGTASNDNQLWGDYFYVNPAENFAQGETLVHVEADALDPETAVAGEYTFYGRYVAWGAADNREPLVGTFATRFAIGGGFDGGTDLLVWRDAKEASSTNGYVCSTGLPRPGNPPWWPLGQEDIVIFDEEENPTVQEGCTVSPCEELEQGLPFPIEAQRVAVNSPALPVGPSFGWLYLNLNFDTGNGDPEEDPAAMQNWVTTVMSAEGRYSVGFDAIALDSSCNANHTNPGEFVLLPQ
jgi:hypothetical protein